MILHSSCYTVCREGQGRQLCFFPCCRASLIHSSQFLGTYPIAKGNMINFAAYTCDPSLTDTYYEGHWVSDATRDELVEYFDGFEPDLRMVIKVSSLRTKQTKSIQAVRDTAL